MALSRRQLLPALAMAPLASRLVQAAEPARVPIRALTRGPQSHWFGYYDKFQFDPTDRYALGMRVGFEHRQPTADDKIALGMIDTRARDRWIPIGETRAWCWQQGCMLQWLPGSKTEVIWNDREGDRFVSRIHDTRTKKSRTLPGPIYAVSPDGTWAVSTDFRRLADLRPGYGYAGIPDPNKEVAAPTDAGVWRMDLRTGKIDLIFSIADALKVKPAAPWEGAKHWFNHLLVAPDGKRIVWLHRFRGPGQPKWKTRMLTANPDGTQPHLVNTGSDVMMVSHFIWRDPTHILAWANMPKAGDKFYVFEDRSTNLEVVGDGIMTEDGHCTYLPRHGNEWILNDTYAHANNERLQRPYLFHIPTNKRIELAALHSPPAYQGPWRVDTHPRVSRDGTKVIVDSAHEGKRQLYMIDVSQIVGPPRA